MLRLRTEYNLGRVCTNIRNRRRYGYLWCSTSCYEHLVCWVTPTSQTHIAKLLLCFMWYLKILNTSLIICLPNCYLDLLLLNSLFDWLTTSYFISHLVLGHLFNCLGIFLRITPFLLLLLLWDIGRLLLFGVWY